MKTFLEMSRIFSILLILASELSAQGDTLRVVGGQGDPGTTGNIVPVSLVNTVEVMGLEFNLVDTPDFLISTDVRTTSRTAGFTAGVNASGHVVLLHLLGVTIPPGAGPILEILYNVDPGANVSEVSLTLRDVVVSDANARPIPNVISVNGTFTIPNPVPVELISFEAVVEGNNVLLRWFTASETNNFGFEIQRSEDSFRFIKVGFVAGHGTTAVLHTYTFIDPDLSEGTYYYRLKQIETDGNFEYSFIEKATVNSPRAFELKPNYPNPFKAETEIRYQLPKTSHVSLKIFNTVGQEVRLLVDEQQQAGFFRVRWDGRDNWGEQVSSGLYFYTLEAGEFHETRKALLLR